MSSPRLAGIPMDHVVAEVAAFPLASEAALELGPTSLDPRLASEGARRLWREAERHALGSFPAFSVDEAVAIRDATWYAGDISEPVALHTYLRGLAHDFLEARGPVAVPRLGLDHGAASAAGALAGPRSRERWRWLALALPPDLLLAALGPSELGPDRVELLSPALDRHLHDHHYAEMHLHVGAAIDFPLAWVSVLRALAYPDLVRDEDFQSPGACLDEGRRIRPWLIRAALVRYLLAAFLFRARREDRFRDYLRAQEGLWRQLRATKTRLLEIGLEELCEGRLRVGEFELHWRSLYAEVTGLTAESNAFGQPHPSVSADPIAPFLPPSRGSRWSAEMRFIAAGLAYLEERGDDPLFTRLFWQVTRLRVLFYRHVVQRPMTPGLQWFVRFYGRGSPARRLLPWKRQLESAALMGGSGRGLCSLEVRTSPDARRSTLRTLVKELDEIAELRPPRTAATGVAQSAALAPRPSDPRQDGRTPPSPPLELGIVFHFTKDRGGGALRGTPGAYWRGSEADPRCDPAGGQTGNPSGYRYSQYYKRKRDEAHALTWLLRTYPLSLEIIRGVDVCTDEIGVPNWILAPLLAYVREVGEAVAAVAARRYGVSLPGLRTTVHAGEDFVHLLTGLRQVDEAIEGFGLRSGDRIGHGIALGVDPRDWARRAGRIPMMREERLFDLAWAWSWYGRGGRPSAPGRMSLLDREIDVLSQEIFGKPVTPYELELLRRDLHDPPALRRTGFPDGPPPPMVASDARLNRLRDYLTNPTLFARGRQLIWVDTGSEGEWLASLQAELRAKVGACGIAVEVNPTSNLLIGNLGDLTVHPLWRLRPPRPADDAPPVSVCVGSDDPLVFGSDLRQEYQSLCDAMVLAGLSDEEARRWLDRTRATGLEARFTLSQRSGRDIFEVGAISLEEPAVNLPP